MSLTNIVIRILGIILAIFGLFFTIQHAGFNFDMLVGLALLVIGAWLALGLPVSI